jgi:hypothetical protein
MTEVFTKSQWDPTKIRARAGKIFIVPNLFTAAAPPTALASPYSPAIAAALLTEYLAMFYTDGNIQGALVTGLQPWAYIDAKGLEYEAKYEQSAFTPAIGLPINTGKYLKSAIASAVIGDISTAKFQDILSTTANEVISIAASTTQAAKSAVMMGTTPYNSRYMVLYQWPSLDLIGVPIPGQYDNLLIPRAIIDSDVKVGFMQSKPSDLPIKITAENDLFLMSPDSGLYCPAVFQETTAAHS